MSTNNQQQNPDTAALDPERYARDYMTREYARRRLEKREERAERKRQAEDRIGDALLEMRENPYRYLSAEITARRSWRVYPFMDHLTGLGSVIAFTLGLIPITLLLAFVNIFLNVAGLDLAVLFAVIVLTSYLDRVIRRALVFFVRGF